LAQKGASGNVLDGELNPINGWYGEVSVNPKKDPFFKHFLHLIPTILEGVGVPVNTSAFWNCTIVTSVIRKNLIFCVAECRLNVLKEHWQFPSVQNSTGTVS
jgi:hypothetical protein